MTATAHQQPVLNGRKLTTYNYNGLMVDLYGALDEDGYMVEDIAVAGSTVSLFELVTPAFLESLSRTLDLTMPSPGELRRQSRAEARIDAYEFDRMVA